MPILDSAFMSLTLWSSLLLIILSIELRTNHIVPTCSESEEAPLDTCTIMLRSLSRLTCRSRKKRDGERERGGGREREKERDRGE